MNKVILQLSIILSCISCYTTHIQAEASASLALEDSRKIEQSRAQKPAKKTARTDSIAEWTVVCYIQADNNLAPFAEYNIEDMQRVGSTKDVNILVQWDQPFNNKTWRYYIEKGNKVDAGSLNQEMGIRPDRELIDMMKWAKKDFPAKHYMMVLWNHGNGVSDLRNGRIECPLTGWLQPPTGSTLLLDSVNLTQEDRGILYDDSQQTFLTNRALQRVCRKIKLELGQNIDIVGCDACLMAMIEVAHNMKSCVDLLVASQELEPAEGWAYSGFLQTLVDNAGLLTAEEVGTAVVAAYDNFYKDDSTHTQSAININKLDPVYTALNSLSQELIASHKINADETLRIINAARRSATEFYVQDYIDLHSFLVALVDQAKRAEGRLAGAQNASDRAEADRKERLKARIGKVRTEAETTQQAVLNSMTANMVGSTYAQAKGMSIYFPSRKKIDRTYKRTSFARQTKWLSFLKAIGKK